MSRNIELVMRDGRFIRGVPYAPGERVIVPAAEAHEIVTSGWASYLDPADAAIARKAFDSAQAELLAKLERQRPTVKRAW